MTRKRSSSSSHSTVPVSPSPDEPGPTLAACAGILAAARSADEELRRLAEPILSYPQKRRVAQAGLTALGWHALGRTAAPMTVTRATMPLAESSVSPPGASLQEVEDLVRHRVQMALAQAAQERAAELRDSVDIAVRAAASSQEGRLLEVLTRNLTDSLKILQGDIDERMRTFVPIKVAPVEFSAEDLEEIPHEVAQEVREDLDFQETPGGSTEYEGSLEMASSDGGDDLAGYGNPEMEGAEAEAAEEEALQAEEAARDAVRESNDLLDAIEDVRTGAVVDTDYATLGLVMDMVKPVVQESDAVVGGDGEEEAAMGGEEEDGDEEDQDEEEPAAYQEVPFEDERFAAVEEGESPQEDALEEEPANPAPLDRSAVEEGMEGISVHLEGFEALEDQEPEVAPGEAPWAEGEDAEIVVALDLGGQEGEPVAWEEPASLAPELAVMEEESLGELEGEGAVILDFPSPPEDEEGFGIEILADAGGPLAELGPLDDGADVESLPATAVELAGEDAEGGHGFVVDLSDDEEGAVDLPPTDGRPATPEEVETVNRYLELAAELRSRKNYPAALEVYSKVLEIDARNFDAFVGRGVLYLETGEMARAAEEFRKAQYLDPGAPEAYMGLGEVYFVRKQYSKAVKYFTRSLSMDPHLADAHYKRGLSLYHERNYKKAFIDLNKAYKLDPDLPHIKKYLQMVMKQLRPS